jgi:hypothetical protein
VGAFSASRSRHSSRGFAVDGAVPLSVTDQGRRGARVFGDVTPVRGRTSAALAQPTGLWLLAHNGHASARNEVGRSTG